MGGGAEVVGGDIRRAWGLVAVEVVTGSRVRGVGLETGVSSSSVDKRASAAYINSVYVHREELHA